MRACKACVAAAMLVAAAGIAVAQYDFTVDKWLKLGVTPWPVVNWCLPASDMSALLSDMEAALNKQDIPAALG